MENAQKDAYAKQLLIITILLWFSLYVHVPFQTPYLSGIAVPAGFIGLVIGTYGLMQVAGRIPIGIFADLYGNQKPFIVGGMFCTFLASLIRVIFPTGGGYLAANFFSGLAACSWICFIVMYTNLFSKEELSKSTGMIISIHNVGIFLGFAAGMILRDIAGMNVLCMAGTIVSFVGLILSFFLPAETNHSSKQPTKADFLQLFRNPNVIFWGLVALVQQGIVSSTANSFTTQVAKDVGANAIQIGIGALIYILSAVISSNFNSRRLKPGVIVPILFMGLAIYCFLAPNMSSVVYLYPLQILAGLSQGWLYSCTTAEAMKEVPDAVHSTAMGYYASIYAVGMTLFPMFTGEIAEQSGIPSAFYVLMAISVLSAVLVCLRFRRKAKLQPVAQKFEL
jgi:MFS family permease